jgi:2-polyprenyl-3-methyl-5-hydroxy-6-metoxy-1,4-benzoquinol methylase
MTAAAAEAYDQDVRDRGLATLPLAESPWLPLYSEVLRWLPRTARVIDLGCGTGRFARLLADYGIPSYHGIDFSAAAITEAGDYVRDEGFTFEHADLRDWQPGPIDGATVFVCLEVLEHLADDRDLIRRVPPGHRLVLSVPSYPSEHHVRTFQHPADVFRRYERLLDFTAWRALDVGPPGRTIHLCDTRRRVGSWT